MKANLHSVPEPNQDATLSIGDLARLTGVTAATLRVWETRYGFPVPQRRDSGHRRYVESDVHRIREVLERREAGVRLDVAIEKVLSTELRTTLSQSSVQSVFAQLRRTHPALMPHRLSKGTLLALSWAIEDEFASRAHRAHLFGAFQRTEHYVSAQGRWEELARVASSSYVFADFEEPSGSYPHRVALAPDAAMRREWSVICDSPELPVALSAWELPGQQHKRNSQRQFEAIWTVDPTAVREAARVCASVAEDSGSPVSEEVKDELRSEPSGVAIDLTAVTSLFNRVIAYIDSPPPR